MLKLYMPYLHVHNNNTNYNNGTNNPMTYFYIKQAKYIHFKIKNYFAL